VTSGRRGARRVPISVVILNWNTYSHTIECLESLATSDPGPATTILVDNGSTDGSFAALTAWADRAGVSYQVVSENPDRWPPARDRAGDGLVLVPSTTNRGFSGGNNLALAYLGGAHAHEHILLLNNDTIVPPDYFAHLAAALAARPDAALLSGTIYEWPRRDRVWYAGGRYAPIRTLVHHLYDVPADPTPVPTDFVCGCAMLISPHAVATLGGLAECYYPGYGEDTEYSWRAGVAGLPRLYAPAAVIYHKVGAAHGVSPRTAATIVRHRAYWARRNLRGWRLWAALTYLTITKPARIILELVRGRQQSAALLAGATWHGLFDRISVPRWPEPLPAPGSTSAP
jgi:GT2 family glycosyltransferase